MQSTLDGNKSYVIDGVIFVSSSNAGPDLKIRFRYPVDAIADLGFIAASDSFCHTEFIQNHETPSGRIPITANTPIVIHASDMLKMNGSGTTTLVGHKQPQTQYRVIVIERSYLRADAL